jgi:hypothetical protein
MLVFRGLSAAALSACFAATGCSNSRPWRPVHDHQATGFLVLCTNLKYVGEVSAFERINVASQNDYNYHVSDQGC